MKLLGNPTFVYISLRMPTISKPNKFFCSAGNSFRRPIVTWLTQLFDNRRQGRGIARKQGFLGIRMGLEM